MKSLAEDSSDSAALLGEARHRADALLAGLHREQSQWESAQADATVAAQGKAAIGDVIAAIQALAAAIDADCSKGQRKVDQGNESSHHDE